MSASLGQRSSQSRIRHSLATVLGSSETCTWPSTSITPGLGSPNGSRQATVMVPADVAPFGRELARRLAVALDGGLAHNMAPHRLRHFVLAWLKSRGLDDALLQSYSGHASRKSLEVYSRFCLADAQ